MALTMINYTVLKKDLYETTRQFSGKKNKLLIELEVPRFNRFKKKMKPEKYYKKT